jgi:sRNA-binding carbon storage regulator CsrA
MLRIDLKIGQSIKIGDGITITLDDKTGKTAKLAIEADPSIRVQRVQPETPVQHVAAMGLTGKP